jgi:hypothetical protein
MLQVYTPSKFIGRTQGVVQVVEHLLCKHEVPTPVPPPPPHLKKTQNKQRSSTNENKKNLSDFFA